MAPWASFRTRLNRDPGFVVLFPINADDFKMHRDLADIEYAACAVCVHGELKPEPASLGCQSFRKHPRENFNTFLMQKHQVLIREICNEIGE